MNQVININHPANKNNTLQNIAQSIFDFVTFKAIREIFDMKFDITLDKEDMQHIEAQLWK